MRLATLFVAGYLGAVALVGRVRLHDAGEALARVLQPFVQTFVAIWVLQSAAGCHDLDGVKTAANATRATAQQLIAVVDATCTEPYERAALLEPAQAGAEVLRLDRLGCQEALAAQTAVAEAHATMVALIQAYEAGACVATVASPIAPGCDLAGATARAVEAGARLARAVDALGAVR